MEYFLFALQIIIGGYLITNKIADSLKFGYIIYFLIAVASLLLFYLMYKMEFSKLVVTLLTFVLGTFFIKVSYLFNLIPFTTLYFYIISRIKENEIFENKHYIYLVWIILLGFIPVKVPGLFEKNFLSFFKTVISFLFIYDLGSSTTYPQVRNANPFNNLRNAFNENATQSARLLGIVNLFAIIISLLVLVMLIILIIYVLKVRIKSSTLLKRESNKLILFTLLLAIASVLLVLISFISVNSYEASVPSLKLWHGIIILLLYYAFVFLVYKIVSRNLSQYIPKEGFTVPKGVPFVLTVTFLLLIMLMVLLLTSETRYSVIAMSLGSILALSLIFYYALSIRGEASVIENHPVFKNSQKVIDNFKKYGEEYLNMIENERDFITFLYFLCLLEFAKIGIQIKEEVTPREFLYTVKPYLKTDLFDLLTRNFYVAEYSNSDLDNKTVEFLKVNAKSLLNEIREIKVNKEVLEFAR